MKLEQRSIGKDAAIALAESNWWEGKSDRDIFAFQMQTQELCMPFGRFHEAAEKALGRSVWTHEFARSDLLWTEFNGDAPAPTFQNILDLIPAEKRMVIAGSPLPPGSEAR